MTRVLIATDVFPPKCGGSGWSAFYLARALSQRGHHVTVVQPRLGLKGTRSRTYGELPVVEVGYRAANVPGLRAWRRTAALENTLARYLASRAREFDLIHAQHLLTIPAAITAKELTGIPVVSTVRDYWHVCLYGTLWREDGICPICRGAELTRCLAQKYGARAKLMQPFVPLVERELARRQRALRDSDMVLAVSTFVGETLGGIVESDRLRVIPNLVDIGETQRIAVEGAKDKLEGSYLLFVGKLNPLKGADLLPEILDKSGVKLPLWVAGDGELRAALVEHPGIKVLGWVSNQETLGLIAGAQALLFPSRWAEPLARTLLEAQALGTPTVALNTGGTRDIIKHGKNGLLAHSPDEFASHLSRLSADPVLRGQLAEGALEIARDKFSAEAVIPQLEQVYHRVVREKAVYAYAN